MSVIVSLHRSPSILFVFLVDCPAVPMGALCVSCHRWPDGETYSGDWLDGKKHGQGRHVFPDGREFEGEYKFDRWDGFGILTSKHSRYEGEWKNGMGFFHLPVTGLWIFKCAFGVLSNRNVPQFSYSFGMGWDGMG